MVGECFWISSRFFSPENSCNDTRLVWNSKTHPTMPPWSLTPSWFPIRRFSPPAMFSSFRSGNGRFATSSVGIPSEAKTISELPAFCRVPAKQSESLKIWRNPYSTFTVEELPFFRRSPLELTSNFSRSQYRLSDSRLRHLRSFRKTDSARHSNHQVLKITSSSSCKRLQGPGKKFPFLTNPQNWSSLPKARGFTSAGASTAVDALKFSHI